MTADGDGFGDNERGSVVPINFPSTQPNGPISTAMDTGTMLDGTNPDAFIADPTQWADADGDGYGDNPTGRLADAFTERCNAMA